MFCCVLVLLGGYGPALSCSSSLSRSFWKHEIWSQCVLHRSNTTVSSPWILDRATRLTAQCISVFNTYSYSYIFLVLSLHEVSHWAVGSQHWRSLDPCLSWSLQLYGLDDVFLTELIRQHFWDQNFLVLGGLTKSLGKHSSIALWLSRRVPLSSIRLFKESPFYFIWVILFIYWKKSFVRTRAIFF